jgi:hypothetical protein
MALSMNSNQSMRDQNAGGIFGGGVSLAPMAPAPVAQNYDLDQSAGLTGGIEQQSQANLPAAAGPSMAEMMAIQQTVQNFKGMQDPGMGLAGRAGSGIGAGAGAYIGFGMGGPLGAMVGSGIGAAVGGGAGSVLDFFLGADERAAARREAAARKKEAMMLRNMSLAQMRKQEARADQTHAMNMDNAARAKSMAVAESVRQRISERLARRGMLYQGQAARPIDTRSFRQGGFR